MMVIALALFLCCDLIESFELAYCAGKLDVIFRPTSFYYFPLESAISGGR